MKKKKTAIESYILGTSQQGRLEGRTGNLSPDTRHDTKLVGLGPLLMDLDLNGSDTINTIK